MIGSLQSLRFIFAIMIFLHHFTGNGGVGLFEAGGSCGVSFFMILSGFVMSVGYFEKVQLPSFNYTSFIGKRLIRVYPLHFLCLIGFVVLTISTLTLFGSLKLIPNLLLLQSWIPEKEYYFSGNAVSWCLCNMLFFYLVFPFLVRGIAKYSKSVLTYFCGATLTAYFVFMYFLPEGYVHRFLYISPLFRLLDFILGILIYCLYCKIKKNKWGSKIESYSFTQKTAIECTLVVALAAMLIAYPAIPLKFTLASYYWPIMTLLIFFFAVFNKSGGAISVMLRNKIVMRMGEVSFSFYMIHQLAIGTLNSCLCKLQMDISWKITLPLFFVIILATSFIIYYYYEKPLASFLKRKIR